jgi:hypothetical protein
MQTEYDSQKSDIQTIISAVMQLLLTGFLEIRFWTFYTTDQLLMKYAICHS